MLCCIVKALCETILVAVADSDNVPLPWNTGIRDDHPLYVVVSELRVPLPSPSDMLSIPVSGMGGGWKRRTSPTSRLNTSCYY